MRQGRGTEGITIPAQDLVEASINQLFDMARLIDREVHAPQDAGHYKALYDALTEANGVLVKVLASKPA